MPSAADDTSRRAAPASATSAAIGRVAGAIRRLPLIVAIAALALGLEAGLERMGVGLAGGSARLVGIHGPLMVCGFFGTLIGMERAVALGHRWCYAAPILAALGAFVCVFAPAAGAVLTLLSSVALAIASVVMLQRRRTGATLTMTHGAASWLIGNVVWASGATIAQAVPWWSGFLVLSIAGGRRRQSQPRRWAGPAFGVAVATIVVGLGLATSNADTGARLAGVGLVGLSMWLVAFDVQRTSLEQQGLSRYTALSLLAGYAWLAAAGALAAHGGTLLPGHDYDARAHALFLGFVFSVVFGQAPVVFPGMLNAPFDFGRRLYVPLATLHVSLLLRVAGDFAGIAGLRQLGGLLGAAAIVLFVGAMASLFHARRASGPGVA